LPRSLQGRGGRNSGYATGFPCPVEGEGGSGRRPETDEGCSCREYDAGGSRPARVEWKTRLSQRVFVGVRWLWREVPLTAGPSSAPIAPPGRLEATPPPRSPSKGEGY